MRVVLRRDFIISLSGVSVDRMMSDVMLAIVDMYPLTVRLMTMGRTSTSVPGKWSRRALSSGCLCCV
jgi:hypothetical protein